MGELRTLFGRVVRQHRKSRGWSQLALAERAGLSLEMTARIERGVLGASFPTIERIAQAFDVAPWELFDLEGALNSNDRLQPLLGRLVGLDDAHLAWIETLIEAALKKPA